MKIHIFVGLSEGKKARPILAVPSWFDFELRDKYERVRYDKMRADPSVREIVLNVGIDAAYLVSLFGPPEVEAEVDAPSEEAPE